MNVQQLLAEAQARADANGDGKLSLDDLKALADEHKLDNNFVDDLRSKVDMDADGKLELDDAKKALEDAGSRAGELFDDAKKHVGDFAEDTHKNATTMVDDVKDKLFGKS